MLDGYNKAFLYTSGNTAYYKHSLSNAGNEGNWVLALDILGEEDAYEASGNSAEQTLVNNLNTTLLSISPPSTWPSYTFNDDLGWITLSLIRGYQMTGNTNLLTQAEYGFNLAFNRGWDTKYNGGGIWETQPSATSSPAKFALSNNSLGKTAVLVYLTTGDTNYLNKAEQIYAWVRQNIYNTSTGQVAHDIDPQGVVHEYIPEVFRQGTFADFANLLYQATGNKTYLNDATTAIDYTIANETDNGILSNPDPSLNTWADDFARAIGHVCGYTPSLWSKYYPFMVKQTNAIWASRHHLTTHSTRARLSAPLPCRYSPLPLSR